MVTIAITTADATGGEGATRAWRRPVGEAIRVRKCACTHEDTKGLWGWVALVPHMHARRTSKDANVDGRLRFGEGDSTG